MKFFPPLKKSFSLGIEFISFTEWYKHILHLSIPLFIMDFTLPMQGSGKNFNTHISLFKWKADTLILWKQIFCFSGFCLTSTKYMNKSGNVNRSFPNVLNCNLRVSSKSIFPSTTFWFLVFATLSCILIFIAYSLSLSGKKYADIILIQILHKFDLPVLLTCCNKFCSPSPKSLTRAMGESTSVTEHFIKILPFHLEPTSAL